MNKGLVLSMCVLLAVSSCGTYTGAGAYTGANLGSILGSAIGGISGGPRGSDVGTLVGMAGGALVGAAVGSAADRAEQQKYEEYQRQRNAPYTRDSHRSGDSDYSYQENPVDESGFDPTHSGDDRIIMDNSNAGYTTVPAQTYSPKTLSIDQLRNVAPGYNINYNEDIELRNVTFVDMDGDGIITGGETSRVSFEIKNHSTAPIYDILPTVIETTKNKHIHISSSIRIESIAPGRGVRYSATVYGDERLRNGNAVIRIAVAQGNNDITSQIKEFNVATRRK